MTEVIGVRFRGGCKEYYFDPHGIAVEAGQFVIVETAQGTEYAQCLTGNHEVDDGAVVRPLRALVRIATENDRRTMEYNRQREKEAFGICQRKIAERGLDMKLVRVECSFDGSKIVFFFTVFIDQTVTGEGKILRGLTMSRAGVDIAAYEPRRCRGHEQTPVLVLSDTLIGGGKVGAKAGGAVNGGAYAPFILTVDWLGWLCYFIISFNYCQRKYR